MRRALIATMACATAVTACGASIQAVYEGDVRFEHCMALDARADVKPTLRRACWEEWTKFYTFGQTRDRVEHAKLRQKQLSASSDFDEGEWSLAQRPTPAVPEPTSVLAPPPQTLAADGGPTGGSPDLDGGADADAEGGVEDAALPGSTCAGECEQTYTLCKQDCSTTACEKTCTTRYKRCMRRCY
jgi:hypothetical protein